MTDDRVLGTLGLARRSGNLAVGEEPVAAACRGGQARVVLLAGDAADNTARKAARLGQERDIPVAALPYDKGQVGFALGRSSCAVLAVTDAGLAALLLEKLAADDPERYGQAAAALALRAAQERKKKTGRGKAGQGSGGRPAKGSKHGTVN